MLSPMSRFWSLYTNTANYGVVMIKKQATNMDGTPALLVSGIQTAGTVINARIDLLGSEPVIVLPQPDTWPAADDPYWNYLQASARNEGEHAIEYKNDLNEFIIRATSADVHPHWTLPDGSRSLVAEVSPVCKLDYNPKAKATKISRPK
jgi:hypothetical protein